MLNQQTMTAYIYQRTGFPQEDIARFIGVSKSLLSKYENGHRDLPTDAYLKIISMYNSLKMVPENAAIPNVSAEVSSSDKVKADWCYFKCEVVKEQLKQAIDGYQQGETLMQWYHQLENEQKEVTIEGKISKDEIYEKAILLKNKYSWEIQENLKIYLAKYEVEFKMLSIKLKRIQET